MAPRNRHQRQVALETHKRPPPRSDAGVAPARLQLLPRRLGNSRARGGLGLTHPDLYANGIQQLMRGRDPNIRSHPARDDENTIQQAAQTQR